LRAAGGPFSSGEAAGDLSPGVVMAPGPCHRVRQLALCLRDQAGQARQSSAGVALAGATRTDKGLDRHLDQAQGVVVEIRGPSPVATVMVELGGDVAHPARALRALRQVLGAQPTTRKAIEPVKSVHT
jgi:hypothetical protein